MEPVVRLRSVVALLGGFPALAGADLTVDAGEAVLLRGPNGAGKSTVLRVCAGLVPVAEGEASVLGVDLRADRRSIRRRIAMLGHAGFLYDDLTVRENVDLRRRGARAATSQPLPARWRGSASTDAWPTTRVAALSAGQRRRTALAALVARDAELWLLDEPHAGLDDDGSRPGRRRRARRRRQAGATVVIASHDTDRATALGARGLSPSPAA